MTDWAVLVVFAVYVGCLIGFCIHLYRSNEETDLEQNPWGK